jgi:C_GCAxxG_C_C family probable redox protein
MMSKDKVKRAYKAMTSHSMNCAQSVLTSFCEEFGLEKDLALKIARGFGGGMHINSVCGAVTGAYMVLGLANPVSKENPRQSMDKLSALRDEFNHRFTACHGSLQCTELIGYDLSIPEKAAEAFRNDVFTNVCPGLVRDAVKILEDLLVVK